MENSSNKILMIAATPFFSDRGCHIRIYNEIKYLKKEGVDVTLCTYHIGNNIENFNIKRIKNVSWYAKITPGASWGKLYLDFLLLILSYKEYLKNKPKIIHAHLYEGLCVAWFIKIFSFFRVKIVFDCQGSLAEEMYAYTLHKTSFLKPLYYFFVLLEKILIYIPDKIVCSSTHSYNFLISKYNISKNKIDILNDGIDTDLFYKYLYETDELRVELEIPKDSIIILYTGSISNAKGLTELLEEIPLILSKNKNITFVFAGYGELENKYKEKLSEYVQNKQVLFLGRFSYFELPKYIAIADYAIDPKRNSSESSGKMLNYISGGLSVICFRNDFNYSVLKDTGIYINTFLDIINIVKQNKIKQIDTIEISWNKIIKRLINVYIY